MDNNLINDNNKKGAKERDSINLSFSQNSSTIISPFSVEELINQNIEELKKCKYDFQCSTCPNSVCITLVSVAEFPSEFGEFQILGFVNNKDNKDHVIILKGDISVGENVLTRIHSQCLTGDALGSRRCDCGPQLHEALRRIEKEGKGILLYHREEGRGIGLTNKLRAYNLQDHGIDTLDANTLLGFKPDERSYEVPAAMLKKIGVKSVKLMTNNPDKVKQLEEYGIHVSERIPIELPVHNDNINYLKTKKERFGHFLKIAHKADF